ncbi:hypothetical protein WH47_07630, partial [Habropoda laboriosa]
RGRLSFRTYNPAKITKYGILVRMVCEGTTGYICNFDVYCAQGYRLNTTVHLLLQPFINLGHVVYMDNYYNSIQIAEEL